MVKESDKYAASNAIGLPYVMDGNVMKPTYSAYDYDTCERGCSQQGRDDNPGIRMDSRRGSVKVIWPLSSVWNERSVRYFHMKAKRGHDSSTSYN
jgi:hypothetical protein